MAFRTRLERRYEYLREHGFLPFEARRLATVRKQSAPYLEAMVKGRANTYRAALKNNWTKTQYRNHIYKQYAKQGWAIKTPAGKMSVKSVWNLLRAQEDRYRAKFPEWESPSRKKGHGSRDFVKGVEEKVKGDFRSWADRLKEREGRAKTDKQRAKISRQRQNLETWTT